MQATLYLIRSEMGTNDCQFIKRSDSTGKISSVEFFVVSLLLFFFWVFFCLFLFCLFVCLFGLEVVVFCFCFFTVIFMIFFSFQHCISLLEIEHVAKQIFLLPLTAKRRS